MSLDAQTDEAVDAVLAQASAMFPLYTFEDISFQPVHASEEKIYKATLVLSAENIVATSDVRWEYDKAHAQNLQVHSLSDVVIPEEGETPETGKLKISDTLYECSQGMIDFLHERVQEERLKGNDELDRQVDSEMAEVEKKLEEDGLSEEDRSKLEKMLESGASIKDALKNANA